MTDTTEPDVLEVRPDGRRSRFDTPPPRVDANPDEIGEVDAKVAEFRRLYPDSIIDATDVEQLAENAWLVTARVWKDRTDQDGLPDSTGSSVRFVNLDGHESEAYPLESAQTVAIGRALRFLPPTEDADGSEG